MSYELSWNFLERLRWSFNVPFAGSRETFPGQRKRVQYGVWGTCFRIFVWELGSTLHFLQPLSYTKPQISLIPRQTNSRSRSYSVLSNISTFARTSWTRKAQLIPGSLCLSGEWETSCLALCAEDIVFPDIVGKQKERRYKNSWTARRLTDISHVCSLSDLVLLVLCQIVV